MLKNRKEEEIGYFVSNSKALIKNTNFAKLEVIMEIGGVKKLIIKNLHFDGSMSRITITKFFFPFSFLPY
ncbi:MAG: hypothetical protein ACTSR8_04425 [Promethearchaeota archaeon]